MNAREFYELTKKVRAAQKAYFKTRLKSDFEKSKALERQLDNEIERVENLTNPKPVQTTLNI